MDGRARARTNKVGILKPRDDLEMPLDASSIHQTVTNNGRSHFFDQGRIGDSQDRGVVVASMARHSPIQTGYTTGKIPNDLKHPMKD